MYVTWSTIASLLRDFGLPTVCLVVVIYGFVTERIVPGGAYARMRMERDAALLLLQRQGEANERELSELRARLEGLSRFVRNAHAAHPGD